MNKLIDYVRALSEEDKLLLVKKQASAALTSLRKRNKASLSEFNHKGDRGGRNCSKNQTLYSNSYNAARIYDSLLVDLKIITKHL